MVGRREGDVFAVESAEEDFRPRRSRANRLVSSSRIVCEDGILIALGPRHQLFKELDNIVHRTITRHYDIEFALELCQVGLGPAYGEARTNVATTCQNQ